jgi:crotonobetainyl-CoA:carnitine CoA-transferase CaiB-like acyl-CoA transferase
MVLADMGADVIKVEDPGLGDYLRAIPPVKPGATASGRFLAINRGKRSLVLDLKNESGRAALLRMAARADLVVETFRPGVLDRLGVGYAALRQRNRAIVLCSISGYGQSGPYRDRAGHDLNYIALAGVLGMGGDRGGAPAMPGVQIADLAGGALWAAVAVLGALLGRQQSGEGAHLDISMTEGALALLAAEIGNLDCGDRPARGTTVLNGGAANYNVYRTADGHYLAVGALEPKFWSAFCTAIGRSADAAELVAPPERQRQLHAEVQAILATRTRDEWLALFAAHDCCVEPVLDLAALPEHPLHRERAVFFTLDGGASGPVLQLRTPVGGGPGARLAPRRGEHSAEVLAEYGFSEEEIAQLTG